MKPRVYWDRIAFIFVGVAFLVLCWLAGEVFVSH